MILIWMILIWYWNDIWLNWCEIIGNIFQQWKFQWNFFEIITESPWAKWRSFWENHSNRVDKCGRYNGITKPPHVGKWNILFLLSHWPPMENDKGTWLDDMFNGIRYFHMAGWEIPHRIPSTKEEPGDKPKGSSSLRKGARNQHLVVMFFFPHFRPALRKIIRCFETKFWDTWHLGVWFFYWCCYMCSHFLLAEHGFSKSAFSLPFRPWFTPHPS